MPNRRTNVWLLPILLFALTVEAQNGPQPCPDNPIVLTANTFGQFVYSPYDEQRKYPPNTDCRFILVARTLKRRIHINVIESQLEEPIFEDCKDYVSIRDGPLPTSDEIIRWCGSNFPPALSSSGDSLYIHFHSDNIIQSRGFNLSFVDYEVPGCTPEWVVSYDRRHCYRLFESPNGYTFANAQQVCFYERSNLLTIENAAEYDFISSQFSTSHTFPWIGYNDANKEGIFDPIDPNVRTWPENFPNSKTEHSDKDCVYLDWNSKAETAHTIEDCRIKHSLICKKNYDGTTLPIQLSKTLIRYGFSKASFDYTILIVIAIILLILLIILWIIWIIYKKCKRSNSVAASNRNQLVAQPKKEQTKSTIKTNTTSNDTSPAKADNSNLPRIVTQPNQPIPEESEPEMEELQESVEQTAEPIKVVPKPSEGTVNTSPTRLNVGLAPVAEPVNPTGFSSTRSKTAHIPAHTFERPRVGTLENISAISLDEFWE